MLSSPPVFLVTGTNTGVGKTVVCSALARALADRGIRVVAVKPIESGCDGSDNEDGRKLAIAARQVEPLGALLRLKTPVAPPVAASLEKVEINPNELVSEIKRLAGDADVVLVEGAGGLLSPLAWDYNAIDMARDLGASALVVASDSLGTINHTLLTIQALEHRQISVIGLVLSAPNVDDDSTGTNLASLEKLTDLKTVLSMPRVTSLDVAAHHITPAVAWLRSHGMD